MSIERSIGLTLICGAVVLAGLIWRVGLYPREPLPPAEHPSTTVLRARVLTAAEREAARLGDMLDQLEGNSRPTFSAWRR